MAEELKKRTWHYVQKPWQYEICCDKCNGTNIEWSEYDHRIWCYDCKIDTKGTEGIFGGPIPVQIAAVLGMNFDRYDMEKKSIFRYDNEKKDYINWTEKITNQFNVLADAWEKETLVCSFGSMAKKSENYAKLLALGKNASIIPLIFKRWAKADEKDNPNLVGYGFWYELLPDLLDKYPESVRLSKFELGKMKILKAKWFAWAKEKGLWTDES